MIKLLIEIDNIWSILDLGDDKPAMNYQANNIAELKNRQADYSQNLKLPPTKNNCQLFGNSDSFDVITDFPYQKHNCRLFSNDSVLAGPGSFLILDRVTDCFEVQILSGNADLFTTLGNSKMSDLNLGSCILGAKNIYDGFTDGKYCYSLATFLKGGSSVINPSLEHAYPFVFIKPIIENILKSNGYNLPDGILETNLTDDQWNKKALSLCSLISSPDSFDLFKTAEGYINSSYDTGGAGYGGHLVDSGNGTFSKVDNQSFRLISKINGVIKLNIVKTLISGLNPITLLIEIVNETSVETIKTITDTGLTSEVIDINVNQGDSIKMTVTFVFPSSGSSLRVSFNTSDYISNTVPVGGKLYFAPNIGFDTQLDFFKMFVQLFGLTISVDYETKTVKAFTMQKLYYNKPIAKDWSKKLNDIKTNELNFQTLTASYGQSNFVRFDDNTDDNVKDSGSFLIQNNTLQITKDLFGIKLEAGLDVSIGSLSIANIPIEEKDTEGVITFKGGKSHIIDIIEIHFTDPRFPEILIRELLAKHAKVQSFIDSFYPGLITMLSDAKYKTDQFYLTDQDIEDFDPFIPVYISKYGAYFYVNKINNYISKTLTKVELVKL